YWTVLTAESAWSAQPCHMISFPPAALNAERSGFVAFMNSPLWASHAGPVSKLKVIESNPGPKTKYLKYWSWNVNWNGAGNTIPRNSAGPVIQSCQPVPPSSAPGRTPG